MSSSQGRRFSCEESQDGRETESKSVRSLDGDRGAASRNWTDAVLRGADEAGGRSRPAGRRQG
eukprot:16870-Pleurochrysis_carterae.AAC.1